MKAFYFIVIAVILLVLGMLFYPSLHLFIGGVDRTGFLPLLSSAVVFLPYVFLFFVVYGIMRARR